MNNNLTNNEIFLYKRKPFTKDGLNVWMAFPGIYSFGMSALGFLTVFKSYDTNPNINCERIFSDTKTTQISIQNVNMISFSFSFELDFLTIFKILEKYNIPLRASERDDTYPLICAGGPVVTANPEPFAEMFDFIEIGDAEGTINIINDKIEIELDIELKTAEKKFEQNIMNLLPFFIILYMNFTSSSFLLPLYTTFVGRLVMSVALVVYYVSYSISKKILDIEV